MGIKTYSSFIVNSMIVLIPKWVSRLFMFCFCEFSFVFLSGRDLDGQSVDSDCLSSESHVGVADVVVRTR